MVPVAEMAMFKLFMILFLGARPFAPAPPGVPLRLYVGREVPLYAEANLAAVRRMVAETPELQEVVYGGRDPAQAYEQAAAQLARKIGATAADVKKAASSIQRVGFWLYAFGEDEENLRFLLLFDCGGARDVLSALLRGAADEHEYAATSYAGATVHSLGELGEGVCMAEQGGYVALAMDPLAVHEFLLRAQVVGPAFSRAEKVQPLFQAEVNGGAMLDRVLAMLDSRHERAEFFAVACLADLAACEKLTASFDGRQLLAELHIDRNGRFARALEGRGRPPKLAAAVPPDALAAVVVGLEDPMQLARAIRLSLTDAFAMMDEAEKVEKLYEEFRREIGLDLERDVLSNVTEGAFILAGPDDDDFMFLFETKDAARTAEMAGAFVDRLTRGGRRELELEDRADGWKVWRAKGIALALKGSTVVICEAENRLLNEVLRCVDAGAGLRATLLQRHPRATSMVTFNPLAILGVEGGTEPLLAGLHFAANRLTLEAEVDIPVLAKGLAAVTQAVESSRERSSAMSRMRHTAMAIVMYAHGNERRALPPNLQPVRPYVAGRPETLTSPGSGKRFVYREELAGKRIDEIADPARTVLIHEAADAHPDGGCVGYVDGHVEWLPREAFLREIRRAQGDETAAPAPEPAADAVLQ